jgi:hypothetical protein
LSAGTVPPGMAMSIIDGKFLLEPPEATLAAGKQRVPLMVGATDRDPAIGEAESNATRMEQRKAAFALTNAKWATICSLTVALSLS